MPEVGRLAGEALAVLGILRTRAAPEIRGVGDEREGGLDLGQGFLLRADDKSGATRAGGVLEGIARTGLGCVHADGDGVAHHPRADHADRGLQRFAAGLAGEFPIGGQKMRHGADGFSHDGRSGFDRIRV